MAGTAHYWLPILGLFTGARLNELCQLQITDVKEEEGILFLNITDDANDQRVKTAGSKRRCPIHSTIEMLGFRDFYEWRKASGEKLLFKEVKLSKDGYYSDGMSKACLSPLKLCHYLFSSGADEDGTKETFRRRYIDVVGSGYFEI